MAKVQEIVGGHLMSCHICALTAASRHILNLHNKMLVTWKKLSECLPCHLPPQCTPSHWVEQSAHGPSSVILMHSRPLAESISQQVVFGRYIIGLHACTQCWSTQDLHADRFSSFMIFTATADMFGRFCGSLSHISIKIAHRATKSLS